MRLWSLHPEYLDAKGLVALWREALLAQNVLAGNTKGYRNHPQLTRFKNHAAPMQAIGAYLTHVQIAASRRDYNFNAAKIHTRGKARAIAVSDGQLAFELAHLRRKLAVRDTAKLRALADVQTPRPHPLFTIEKGGIADWERP